jgi:hypothetical protein
MSRFLYDHTITFLVSSWRLYLKSIFDIIFLLLLMKYVSKEELFLLLFLTICNRNNLDVDFYWLSLWIVCCVLRLKSFYFHFSGLKHFIFFFFIILLLYWGYIVTFTKVLRRYHNWIHTLHHFPLSHPLPSFLE